MGGEIGKKYQSEFFCMGQLHKETPTMFLRCGKKVGMLA